MVVDREKEIRNFVPVKFWEIRGVLSAQQTSFPGIVLVPPDNKQTHFPDQDSAEKVKKSVGDIGTVVNVERKKQSTKAPTLYSTLELQKDANRYFKFKASKTDAIAQELYEAGYISYPRTECRFLPTSLVPDIPKLLKPLGRFPELKVALALVTQQAISGATSGKTYVDNSKLTDHHAIIPTTAVFDPGTLSADQKKIYLLVAKRFLSIFLPPYEVANTTVLIDSNGVLWRATGRVVLDKGFSMLYDEKKKDTPLPNLQKGDSVHIDKTAIKEDATKPPERYTDKTLLDAMANAGRFVSAAEQRSILKEVSGIGTGATRSDILEKLESTGMCRLEHGIYIPTDFGMELIAALGDRDICSPAMTADWEESLRDLEEHGNPEKFKQKMLFYIRHETADLIQQVNADLSAYRFEIMGKCPLCGGNVVKTQNYFKCVNYKAETSPCTFIVSRKEVMGVKISDTDIRTLLAGKITGVKKLKTKDGKVYEAPLIINAQGRVSPAIGNNVPPEAQESVRREKTKLIQGICTCPLCGKGKIYRSKNYYICSQRDSGCSFLISPVLCGASITEKDVKTLVAGQETPAKTFTWKSGKTGKATLKGKPIQKGDKKEFKLEFSFQN